MSVEFKQIENIFEYQGHKLPGLGEFREHKEQDFISIIFMCPCGCEMIRSIRVREPIKEHGPGIWGWNGDCEKPTVKPSIQIVGECNWHGWLTDGQFQRC